MTESIFRHNHSEFRDEQDDFLYGASREFERQVLTVLEQNNRDDLQHMLAERHAADIADLILILRPDDRYRFLTAAKFFLNADTLAELDDSIRDNVLDILGLNVIAAAVTDLDTDDAVELIEDLTVEEQRQVLQAIPAGERAMLEEAMTYPLDSAGRMMQRDIVSVPPFWTVGETLSFIRETEGVTNKYYDIYVVGNKHKLIGKVPLGILLKHSADIVLSTIMVTDLHPIPVATDQEKVAHIFQHYALVSAPVIDSIGHIVGMITVDDVVHVIHEEAEEDIMHLANVRESDFYVPVVTTAYWRMRWLVVTLLTSLMASIVIAQFQGAIQQMTALAFFMPIGAAMGGAAGMQVVTIVVRALATQALRQGHTWRAIRKEVSVSLIVGGSFALVAGLIVGFWMHNIKLAWVLSLGIFFNMLWAAFAGTLVPIVLDHFDLDPAVSAGPILMTTTDILGFAIFLGLATLILL